MPARSVCLVTLPPSAAGMAWRTRTLRRPGIRHRHVPCHAMPCKVNRRKCINHPAKISFLGESTFTVGAQVAITLAPDGPNELKCFNIAFGHAVHFQ